MECMHQWSASTSGVCVPYYQWSMSTSGVRPPAEYMHQRSACTSGVHAPSECVHLSSGPISIVWVQSVSQNVTSLVLFEVDPFPSSECNQSRRMFPRWCHLKWIHFHSLLPISHTECALVVRVPLEHSILIQSLRG